MAISDYLQKLVELKNQLVDNLLAKGVTAAQDEKLNSLIPKVLDIEQSSQQADEFIIKVQDNAISTYDILEYNYFKLPNIVEVQIPDTLTEIGKGCFGKCFNLKNITIPNSVTTIGAKAFYNCVSLTELVIPDSVTSIGNNAFALCDKLQSIKIPNSVKSFGEALFTYSGITTITIPNSCTSIGEKWFYSCSSLKTVIIPKSVISIGDNAFSGVNSVTKPPIKDVYYEGTSTDWGNITIGNNNECLTNATRHYNYVLEE